MPISTFDNEIYIYVPFFSKRYKTICLLSGSYYIFLWETRKSLATEDLVVVPSNDNSSWRPFNAVRVEYFNNLYSVLISCTSHDAAIIFWTFYVEFMTYYFRTELRFSISLNNQKLAEAYYLLFKPKMVFYVICLNFNRNSLYISPIQMCQ